MAWGGGTPALIASRFDQANAASTTVPASGTINLVAGRLYIILYTTHRTGGAPDLSTGNTWTGLAGTPTFIAQSATFNGGLRRVGAWYYIPAANESGITVTLDPAGGTNSCNAMAIIEIANGFDSTTPVAQNATNVAVGTNTIACNLTSAPAGDALSLAIGTYSDATAGIDPPSGFTEVDDVAGTGTSSDSGNLEESYKAAQQNITIAKTGTGNVDWGAIHLEIKAAAAGGTTYNQSVSGATSPAGALVKQANKVVAGATSPTGAIVKMTLKPLAGATSPAGALIKQAQKILSGATSPSGSLLKQAQKILAGALSSSGALALTKVVLKTLTGAFTPAGALVKSTAKTLAGATSPAGALVRQTAKTLAGAVTSSGSLVKRTLKTLTATITSSGALSSTKVALRSVGGALAPAGALVKSTAKTVAGALTSSGVVRKQANKILVGVVAPAGTITKRIAKTLSGILSSVGSLVTQFISGGGGPTEVVIGDTSVSITPKTATAVITSASASVVVQTRVATALVTSPAASVAVTPNTATVTSL